MLNREYPYGRVLADTVAQPFRNKELAMLCARIMQRMTGDECDVVPRGPTWHYLVRCTGERWIKA